MLPVVTLHFTSNILHGRSYVLACEKTTVGRSSQNRLCLRHPSLSRRHCEILVYGVEVIVRDLGSRNGTFVNGKRLVSQQRQAKSGDLISFGEIEARIEIQGAECIDDDSSAFFDLSKYQAELQKAEQQQRQSEVQWTLSEQQVDQTLELNAPPVLRDHETALARQSGRSGRCFSSHKRTLAFVLAVILLAILLAFLLD